jgi:hypothetical protein
MGHGAVEDGGGIAQRDVLGDAGVEQLPQPVGHRAVGRAAGRGRSEVRGDPLTDQCKACLAVERALACGQCVVQGGEPRAQGRVVQVRPVDRGPHETVGQEGRIEVEVALAEAGGAVGGPAVVDHVGWQHGDALAGGTAVAGVEVVGDRPGVHDHHGPGVVGVRGIGVVDHPGVEHLGDARHRRTPCLHAAAFGQRLVHPSTVPG